MRSVSKTYRLGSIGGRTLQHDLQSWWARRTGLRLALDHYSRIMRAEVLAPLLWNTTTFGYMSLAGMTVCEAVQDTAATIY